MFGQFTLIIFSSVTISVKSHSDVKSSQVAYRCLNFDMVASIATQSILFAAKIRVHAMEMLFDYIKNVMHFFYLKCSMLIEAADLLSDRLKIISNIFRHHFIK